MKHKGRVEKAAPPRKPAVPRVTSRPELRGSLDRVVAGIDARRGDAEFGAALRAGGLVRQMRREAGLSQRQLGDVLGVSQARVSEIEAGMGSQGPTWTLMERIAAACGRDIGVMPLESPSTEQLQDVIGDVSARAKAAMEKNARIVEELAELTRGNVEAFVASSKAGIQGIDGLEDPALYRRTAFEDAAALRGFVDVKSATDFFKLQSDYARAAFDSAVAENARLSETLLELSGESAVAESARLRHALKELRVAANEVGLGAGMKMRKRRHRGRQTDVSNY